MAASAETFAWLSPAEAILRRPDMYVGPAEPREETELLFGDDGQAQLRTWTLSPVLAKIFDEVFVNALDAASRDDTLRRVEVSVSAAGDVVVLNDGCGIPVEPFKDSERFIPEVVFSEVNAGSNFEDAGRRLAGGRNGVGVVCANVWSTAFEVEVFDGAKRFHQRFGANMTWRSEPEVTPARRRRGQVRVAFRPDYARLGLELPRDGELLRALLRTRCREGAVCVRPGVAVHFEGAKLPDSLASYAEALFGAAPVAREEAGRTGGPQMLAALCRRGPDAPECVAFVNGVRCSSGTHVRHFQERLGRAVQSKAPGGLRVRPQTVREVLGLVLVCRVPDPAFASQGKESLTTPPRGFGFAYEALSATALGKLQRTGALEEIFRRETDRDVGLSLRKTQQPRSRDVLVEKYDAALWSRSDPLSCTLILTEGDSAKALAVAGLSVVGRERFGVFPLRGVPLNVRNVPLKKSLDNKEIANVLRILNVAPGRSPENLRYGRLAIMSDQDLDGAHIAALVVNCVQHLLPDVLAAHPDFLCRIVTPLLRATHGRSGEVRSFYSQQELDAWLAGPEREGYRLKYYKGLGTNSTREAKEIFADLERHTVALRPSDATPAALSKFFDDGRVQDRKAMLTEGYDASLCVDYAQDAVDIDAFLDREVVHFSRMHVRRALPSALDGLTPARRKVLFYFLGLPPGREVKVAQAAAGVAQKTAYHHGEASLVECIVNCAQEHVGTNNAALLEPLGQFGSRHDRPSVHAAARYIFTRASPLARALYPAEDLPVLEHAVEEDERVEPVRYVPVLPVVLLNGATGIGTGFSTSVPSFSLKSLCAAARALLRGEAPPALQPHFEGFAGAVELTAKGVATRGAFEREDDCTLVVTELPVGRWTEALLSELKAEGGPKGLPPVTAVANLSTDAEVRVRVTFAESVAERSDEALSAALRLASTVPATFMHLFDGQERLRLYGDYEAVLREHAAARLELYARRREHQLVELRARAAVLEQRVAFVRHVVAGALVLRGQSEAELVARLLELGLPPLPTASGPSHEHLLGMSFRGATAEQIQKLEAEVERQRAAVQELEALGPGDLWERELQAVEAAHARYLLDRAARQDGGTKRREAVPPPRKRRAVAKGLKAAQVSAS